MDNWEPPADAKVIIVCAANRLDDGFIVTGPRHFDATMRKQINAYLKSINIDSETHNHSLWEQGFIDQFGRFYTREEAMKIILNNEQPFDVERNGGTARVLYSEGLY
jgi:hypothetical protein